METEKRNQSLYGYILEQLSQGEFQSEADFLILERIRSFFGMDEAFIYLRSPSEDVLHLQIQPHREIVLSLPGSLYVDALLFSSHKPQDTPDGAALSLIETIEARLAVIFSTEVLVVEPLIDEHRLLGLVGVLKKEAHANRAAEDQDQLRLLLTVVMNDIKLALYEQRIKNSRHSLEDTLDHAGVAIYVTDFYTYEIFYANHTMAAPYGGASALIGRKCYQALHDNKSDACEFCARNHLLDASGYPTKLYSWEYCRPNDGTWFRMFNSAFNWVDGRLAHVVTSVDITENKRNEYLIEKMALYDALTDIPNRRNFERSFSQVLNAALQEGRAGYLVFVDLDNFKHINDAFGHETGDELLRQVAAYLSTVAGPSAYRYGGDEFILLLEKMSSEEVVALTRTLLQRFVQPWKLKEPEALEYFCTASIGVASFPRDGTTYNALLRAADQAMYEAKKNGKSSVAFSMGESVPYSEFLEKEFALRRAITDGCGEFRLLFHPFVDARTGRWSGAEVLVRWESSEFGLLHPEEFIPICERLGLMPTLGRWIITRSLEQVAAWSAGASGAFFVSLNVSIQEFLEEGFNEHICALIERLKVPYSRVVLELTESLQIYDTQGVKDRIGFLRGKGLRIALDGFGQGYASLERLRNLSDVDFIKVNRQFVTDFVGDELQTALIKTIAMLAHAAGTKVCAEGVESESHRSALTVIGYDFLQGELFQKPLPAEEFQTVLLAVGS